jgi:predicted transcriptional regulator
MLKRTAANAMISLRPNLIDAFLSGEKCVELRRRVPSLETGTMVWFYGKVPCGQVRAVGELRCITVASPSEIWESFGECIGIEKFEFDSYLADLKAAAVLAFETIRPVARPVGLAELREAEPSFQPPQFFRNIRPGELLEKLIESEPTRQMANCKHRRSADQI